MRVLVAYDVNTASPQGARRLRRVARACLDFGQRVQKSVFECAVSQAQLEELRRRLLVEVDLSVDSLRIYRLPEGLELDREVYGASRDVDFDGPLVI